MEICVTYKVITNHNSGKIERIVPVEFCSSERDAAKYIKLFDLQTPADLKDKVRHRYYKTLLYEDDSNKSAKAVKPRKNSDFEPF